MNLIFALGNPGPDYTITRHNVGVATLNTLADAHALSWREQLKFKALTTELTIANEKTLLVIPTTFYNNVGESYHAICAFYRITPQNTLIVHDDLALPFGTVRTRFGGSDAGNNGIKSINTHGGQQSARLRIGIANQLRERLDDADFVLGRFSREEQTILADAITPQCITTIEAFAAGDFSATSHTVIETP